MKKNAFSLLELLAAISIIMILTTVVTIGIGGAINASQASRAQHNSRLMNEAIERFMARGGDVTQVLNSNEPTSVLVDNLRSVNPKSLAFGGPFIEPGMGAKLDTNGWRAVMVATNIQTNARTQIFFKPTNQGTALGIIGFEAKPIPSGFEPIGLYEKGTNRAWNAANAPLLRTSTITVTAPSATIKSNSTSSYY